MERRDSEKKKKKLTKANKIFIEEMAKPAPNQTEAYQKAYPKASKATARINASKLLTNTNISDSIEKRKQEVIKYSNVTPEMVMGATALRAFATIDDAFDSTGHFNMKKARKTGAVHLIKKITRTPNKYGEAVAVEFYSNESAQDKIGNYLGMEQMPKADEDNKYKEAVQQLIDAKAAKDAPEAIQLLKDVNFPPPPGVESEIVREVEVGDPCQIRNFK